MGTIAKNTTRPSSFYSRFSDSATVLEHRELGHVVRAHQVERLPHGGLRRHVHQCGRVPVLARHEPRRGHAVAVENLVFPEPNQKLVPGK